MAITKKTAAPALRIERHIHAVRGRRVMLDSDLAATYGVTHRQPEPRGAPQQEAIPGGLYVRSHQGRSRFF